MRWERRRIPGLRSEGANEHSSDSATPLPRWVEGIDTLRFVSAAVAVTQALSANWHRSQASQLGPPSWLPNLLRCRSPVYGKPSTRRRRRIAVHASSTTQAYATGCATMTAFGGVGGVRGVGGAKGARLPSATISHVRRHQAQPLPCSLSCVVHMHTHPSTLLKLGLCPFTIKSSITTLVFIIPTPWRDIKYSVDRRVSGTEGVTRPPAKPTQTTG